MKILNGAVWQNYVGHLIHIKQLCGREIVGM
jgi:hypothetical protein